MEQTKKFILSRRNQKGQVAIFVALIFQVVFVFFAVLINVGLLVHHKINLQQSTDLAAYYGAMKQAEIMNAISHVNFQMRQAWKLLTWRYRIAGTFAFQPADLSPIVFPLTIGSPNAASPPGAAESFQCPISNVSTLDVPFFCVGHHGMGGWPAKNENLCKVNCTQINNGPRVISPVPTTGGYGGLAAATNQAIQTANNNIDRYCDELGLKDFELLLKFISSYSDEVRSKKLLIQMLGANLSAEPSKAVDMEGGNIKTGSQKTFENNLTEANLKGKISFDTINGLDSTTTQCGFKGEENDGNGNTQQFLSQVKLDLVQFFIHFCTSPNSQANKNFKPVTVYNSNFDKINDDIKNLYQKWNPGLIAAAENKLLASAFNPGFIIGYEKNPWCQTYFGAKSQSEPKIPFLPLAKIKLSAISFAKPFGGSIGPRYMSSWSQGQNKSDGGIKIDQTLPPRTIAGINPSLSALNQAITILPNYSNFVGDQKGLRSAEVVASYQDMLLHRQINRQANDLNISRNKEIPLPAPNSGLTELSAGQWPSFDNWKYTDDPTNSKYDYLALSVAEQNSFLRDLELSVVAPNQFDLAFYSIDPDYYNNYYLKLKGGTAGSMTYQASFDKIKTAANNYGPDIKNVRPDYGYNINLEGNGSTAKGYSVRHQIAVAARIIKKTPHVAQGLPGSDNTGVLKFIPDSPASLLTGWTFQNFSDFDSFPNKGPDSQNTMTFGKCNDANWNKWDETDPNKIYDTPANQTLPPTPGNCVWGGRTGYSVKIISSSLLRGTSPAQAYGGPSTSGILANPVKEDFFNF